MQLQLSKEKELLSNIAIEFPETKTNAINIGEGTSEI